MRFILLVVCLSIFVHVVQAEEQSYTVAHWQAGSGLIGGEEAQSLQAIAMGDSIVAIHNQPARLELAEPVRSTVILAPGSAVRFFRETTDDGKTQLVLSLDRGMVQIDLRNRADYSAMILRGATTETEILGTLLTGERVSNQEDFITLIRGSIKVRLRREVALALNANPNDDIELSPRQGLGASSTSGFGSVIALSSRPQLNASSGERASSEEQSTSEVAEDVGEQSWDMDVASEALDELANELADETTGDPVDGNGSGDQKCRSRFRQ